MSRPSGTTGDPDTPQGIAHMLSFDVEEYFQVEAAAGCVGREQWESIQCRAAPAVDRILDLLVAHATKATFFVLGWVAQRDRGLVRRIAGAGHEIASHGMLHRMVGTLSPEEFRADLRESRGLLEDIAGRPVLGYRAPTFSITHRTAWALDILAEEGFRYDSSVFPIHHDRYGVPGAPRFAHRAAASRGLELIEIPPLTLRLAGVNLPVGGGGYLRLLPVRVVAAALRAAQGAGQCGMLYLHPWEFDPDQPVLPMSRVSRWRHRVGLRRTERKLSWLLSRFRFTGALECIETLTAGAHPTYTYDLRS